MEAGWSDVGELVNTKNRPLFRVIVVDGGHVAVAALTASHTDEQ